MIVAARHTGPNFRQIEAFRAVMTCASISEAGRLLAISQPAVSRLIQELERRSGLLLFERRGGRVMPTPEARRLHEEVERSFIGLDRLGRTMQELRELRHGQVALAAMPALCLDLMPDLLAEFLAFHPDAAIDLHARSSQQIVEWIAAQRFDLGLAGPPFDAPGIAVQATVQTPCVCVMPLGHELAAASVVTAEQLNGHPFVALSQDLTIRHRIDRAFEAAGSTPLVRIETPLSFIACRLVEQGLGIAVVEPFTVHHFMSQTARLEVRPFRPTIEFVFGLLRPETRPQAKIAQLLTAQLLDRLAVLDLPAGARVELQRRG